MLGPQKIGASVSNNEKQMVFLVHAWSAYKKRYLGYGVLVNVFQTVFKGADNPKGCGPFFGLTTADGTDRKNQLKVNWCDGSKVPIDQVLSWECPPTGTRVRLCMHIYRHIYIYTYNSYVSMWCACVTITLTCLT